MKKLLLLMPLVLGVGSSAWASSCTSEALSVYEGAGFSCNIGDLVFSNFTSTGVDTSTNVSEVTGPESGLDFGVDLTAIGPGNQTATVGFLVTCDMCTIDDWALQTGAADSTGTGAVSVVELSTPGALLQNTVGGVTTGIGSATFAPADTSLSVTTSMVLGGGAAGTVTTLGSATNLFSLTPNSTVPEPSSLAFCAGLLGLLPFARRKFVR